MLRVVRKIVRYGKPPGYVFPMDATLSDGTPHPRRGRIAAVTILLKCGHIVTRPDPWPRHPVQIICGMCTFLWKERSAKADRRKSRDQRREERRVRQLMKAKRHQEKKDMAAKEAKKEVKKKLAPKTVAKKKDLKKKAPKEKKAKGPKVKRGPRIVLIAKNLYAPKGSLLSKVLAKFRVADGHDLGKNELQVSLEKDGVKGDGKKDLKALLGGIFRNLLRSGAAVKQREIKKNAELKAFIEGAEDDETEESEDAEEEASDDDDDESDDSESEESDEDASEDEDGDSSDSDSEGDEDGDGDEDEEAKPKKKVVAKKPAAKKPAAKKAPAKKASKKK